MILKRNKANGFWSGAHDVRAGLIGPLFLRVHQGREVPLIAEQRLHCLAALRWRGAVVYGRQSLAALLRYLDLIAALSRVGRVPGAFKQTTDGGLGAVC